MDAPAESNPPKIVEVAAGIVPWGGRLLLAQRPPKAHLGGLWEFPGGKREPGEAWEACLAREFREELGVDIDVGRLYSTIVHAYPDRTVYLRFYICGLLHGQPKPAGCAAIEWVDRDSLRGYPMPAADAGLIEKLIADETLWSTATLFR